MKNESVNIKVNRNKRNSTNVIGKRKEIGICNLKSKSIDDICKELGIKNNLSDRDTAMTLRLKYS